MFLHWTHITECAPVRLAVIRNSVVKPVTPEFGVHAYYIFLGNRIEMTKHELRGRAREFILSDFLLSNNNCSMKLLDEGML